MRKLTSFAIAASLALLASCGGGGGTSTGPTPPAQVIATPGTPNVEPIYVDVGPAALSVRAVNIPYVTLTICVPNTQTCQTIDHIEVDTGSSGLRILSSVLTINLPGQAAPGGLQMAECLQFADGSSFGPVATADMLLPTSGKTDSGLAVQIVGEPAYSVPADCPGTQEDTVPTFGANGILGVGPFIQDCGSGCADGTNVITGAYYTCPTPTTCVAAAIPTDLQVSNPVYFFQFDNNGVIVELPAVAAAGAASSDGSLVFGIGTETNNSLGSATIIQASAGLAYVSANFNGATYMNAALDSGSNAVYFTDSGLTPCTVAVGLYCPASAVNLTSTLTGTNNATLAADFTVGNAESLLSNNVTAGVMPNIGGQIPASAGTSATAIQFDLGLPFFFGRNVFTGLEGTTTSGVTGPWYAY